MGFGALIWVPPEAAPEIRMQCKCFIWEGGGSERRREAAKQGRSSTSPMGAREVL